MPQPRPWERSIAREGYEELLRSVKLTTSELSALLESAAKDAAAALNKSVGGSTISKAVRAAQSEIALGEISKVFTSLWADVGAQVAAGTLEATGAAIQMHSMLVESLGRGVADDIVAQIQAGFQSKLRVLAGSIDGQFELSDRVFKNRALTEGWVRREVRSGILRGVSAREIANSVRSMIIPSTPGGPSYAAMRLGRTELNNAFHNTSISGYRESPWTRYAKWHLSGSHPSVDICDDYAEHDDGLGTGIWKLGDIPSKPHPHCLCYTTGVTVGRDEFNRMLRNGQLTEFVA